MTSAATWNRGTSVGLPRQAALGVLTLAAAGFSVVAGSSGFARPAVLPSAAMPVIEAPVNPALGLTPAEAARADPTSLPSYYSFQWDDACQDECPARVATD